MATKYIKTNDKKIIVFSGLNNHSDFKKYNPVSAGFMRFEVNVVGDINCICYGHSVSLQMKSEPDEDTMLANMQITGNIF
jgi:hypothetical protein